MDLQQSPLPARPVYPQLTTGYAQMSQSSGFTYIQAPQPVANPPNDYMCFNILVTFCCLSPLGVVAILKSFQTREAIRCGDARRAAVYSRIARRWGIIALVIGIIILVVAAIWIGIYVKRSMTDQQDKDIGDRNNDDWQFADLNINDREFGHQGMYDSAIRTSKQDSNLQQ